MATPWPVTLLDMSDADTARQVRTLWAAARLQEAHLLQESTPSAPDDIVPERSAGSELIFGVWSGGTLAGMLCLGPDDEPGQIQITGLAVAGAWQRRGMARALLNDALQRSAGLSLSVVAAAGNAAALSLYAGAGFVVYRRGATALQHARLKLRCVSGAGQTD